MKKEKLLTVCIICLFIVASVFLVITICTKFQNYLYLILALVCTLVGNILNLIRVSLEKKNNVSIKQNRKNN